MSKLQTILNNLDNKIYVTEKLLENSKALAIEIEILMNKLGINSVMSGKYKLVTIHNSVCPDTSLHMQVSTYNDNYTVLLRTSNLSATNESFYLYNDFNASFQKPNRSQIVDFINDKEAILSELAEQDVLTTTLI